MTEAERVEDHRRRLEEQRGFCYYEAQGAPDAHWAEHKDLPGCLAWGRTTDEARKNYPAARERLLRAAAAVLLARLLKATGAQGEGATHAGL